MIVDLKDYLRSRVDLSESELKVISEHAEQRLLRRNDLLLVEGDICRHKTFIVNGLLRTFANSPEGDEHILQFHTQNTWTLDAESYDNVAPSRYNIAAVEESRVLMWTKTDFDQLLNTIPPLKLFSQQLISRAVHNVRNRLHTALSATPEEKYNEFVREHPDLMSRLPLWMIASHLGISLKTLTRLRHAQVQR